MSTATSNSTATGFARRRSTMFRRFAWKEFRMIRGLWLAVALMGLAIQWAERWLMLRSPAAPDADLSSMLFATGLAAAVLYCVGAAATTFSVEHEEETYGFLVRLPATWGSVFAGKLLVALVSAILLAALLLATGWALHGPRSIETADISKPLGVLGFAIVEALAWGALLSLLIKRPLLAAIMTLVVGTLITTMAVNFSSSDSMASLNYQAYAQAMPLRAIIATVIFIFDLLAARRWLSAGTRPAVSARLSTNDRLPPYLTKILTRIRYGAHNVAEKASPRRMLARLLWQTWHESWKLLLAPLGVAIVLFAGIAAAIGLTQTYGEVTAFAMASTLLFAPAVYGAMVFYSDQRRGNYRFLAEHAAGPRTAWLARHIVWLGALVAVWLLTIGAFAAFAWNSHEFNRELMLNYFLQPGTYSNASGIIYDLTLGAQIAVRVMTAASFGVLVAYGIGQLFSMTVRSEILAAFLALLLTFVVTFWVGTICLWQLSAVWFMLPLFAGLMLVTWLRAPDWIAGRNSFRAWMKPTLAIIAPFVLIAMMLPEARLAQIRPVISKDPTYNAKQAERKQAVADGLAALRAGDTTEAARTADMYVRAATRLMTGPDDDLLKPWRKPEYTNFASIAPAVGVGDDDIDEAKIPRDQLAAFKKAQKQQLERLKQRIATAVDDAIEISKRPTCHFHFDATFLEPGLPKTVRRDLAVLANNRTRSDLGQLFGVVAGEPMTEPDQPARRFLAALQMGKHFREGQPSLVVIHELYGERVVLQRIAHWALASGRTKEELREVLNTLSAAFAAPESPVEALLADHLLIRNVIEGKDTPFILTTMKIEPHAYLAYLANDLWWERERALQALERITRQNIYDTRELTQFLNTSKPTYPGADRLRRWLRPVAYGPPELWEIQQPAAVTSYLVSLEYKARVPVSDLYAACCDSEVCRRATLIEIALALYRLDHKKYPPQLAGLVPEYLSKLPLDPYSRQSFHYLPNGLNLPLRYWSVGGGYEQIDPQTPLFWSVGAGDSQPKEILSELPNNNEPPQNGEEPPAQKLVAQYELVKGDPDWWNSNTLAFPLPK